MRYMHWLVMHHKPGANDHHSYEDETDDDQPTGDRA